MERALLAQPPESCTSVYPNSPPARLGLDFLPRVLEALAGFLPLPLFWVEALSSCVSHLAAGAGAQGGLPRLCAELAVAGVNDDEQSWAAEPARVNDAESRWEDDRTSLNTESLLELFATNLGGSSTLPAVFRIMDALLASSSWRGWWAVLSTLGRCLAAALAMFAPHAPVDVDAALELESYASTRVQHQLLQLLVSLY